MSACRTRRLRAGGDDPRASALSAHRDHLRLGHPDDAISTCCAATRRARWTMCRCRWCRKLLRAKVRVFADLYRKTRQLEQLNAELERRVDGAHGGTGAGQCGTGAACRGAHARARGGAGAGARDAEDGEPRPAHRRRCARLQQSADGDPGQSANCCASECRTIRGCCV